MNVSLVSRAKVVNPLMVLFVGEPSMLIVFDAVSTVAVPVLPSCSTSREVPSPMNVLPENARFPPTPPLSVPGKKPAGPVVATRRLSSNRSLPPVSVSPGMPDPTVTTLLVNVIDPAPSTPATPVCPRRRPGVAAQPARGAKPAIRREGELHARRGQRIAGDCRGRAAALSAVGAIAVRSEARRRRSDRTDIAAVAPDAAGSAKSAGDLLGDEDRRIVEGRRARERRLGRRARAAGRPVPAIARREAAVPAGTAEAALAALAAVSR